MTVNTTTPLTAGTGQRPSDFRLHALDLNPGLLTQANGDRLADILAFHQAQADSHWLLRNPAYHDIMGDLVQTVREIQRLVSMEDVRSDAMLAADLLKGMGIWDHPQPQGQWGNARFMAKFLVAYARQYLHAKAYEGSQIRQLRKHVHANGP